MENLLILGAGGHGKVVAEAAMLTGRWDDIAFLDNDTTLNRVIGIPVIGSFDTYLDHSKAYSSAVVAIGNNENRFVWLTKLEQAGFKIPVIIHPSSIVSKFSQIESGTVVLAGAVINADASIAKGCILNTSSTIDHDCVIGNGVHVSPGANVSGTVTINDFSWLGVGASIVNNITIGSHVIVAAGAVVISDIPDSVMVAGVPAQIKQSYGDEL
ncbi:acetyltransferase [Paenibacillus tritici]|uniref:Acetyltransferase n=1 Tax=Paenibacillus tritici TaxID=1873425 RepID=A0ABX2DMJ4_9BACL|nr:acetyltransferase [Paenibacillus tritici]NQX45863.1 acetyltransferase [Paenibacillus tritici]